MAQALPSMDLVVPGQRVRPKWRPAQEACARGQNKEKWGMIQENHCNNTEKVNIENEPR